MATHNLSFRAQVDAWTRETQERLNAVFRESVQRTVEIMQRTVAEGGNMPVDLGTLRSSIVASNSEMPKIDRNHKGTGEPVAYDSTVINLVIAGTDPDQPLYIGYTAGHAPFVEFGTSKMPPRAFVRTAAAQWQSIVAQVAQEAKQRASQ